MVTQLFVSWRVRPSNLLLAFVCCIQKKLAGESAPATCCWPLSVYIEEVIPLLLMSEKLAGSISLFQMITHSTGKWPQFQISHVRILHIANTSTEANISHFGAGTQKEQHNVCLFEFATFTHIPILLVLNFLSYIIENHLKAILNCLIIWIPYCSLLIFLLT